MKRILLALLVTCLTLFGAFFVTSCKSDSSGENNSQTSISSSVSSTSSKTDGEQGNSSSSSSSFSQSLSEKDSEQSKSSSSSSSQKEDSSQGHVHQMQHVARVEATGSTSGNVEYYHCVSCGKNYKDKNGTTEITDVLIPATRKITFKTLTVDENNNVYGKVPNSQTTYSFLTEVSTPQNVSYVLSLDIYGTKQVPTKTVPINVGDNVFYITETVGNDITLYTVTIRRRPVYTVTFNTNCSTVVENQLVEEDFFAIEPKLEKIGYTFLGWNYSFQNPITSDIQITASWSANTDTKYKVEYYLQNLKDDYYTLYETYNFSGTTDTTATAKQLGCEHFSFNYDNSLTSGNIDGDGSLVLKLYYTRNAYVLSNENTEYGEITNGNTIKYGASVTTCATEYLGCEFVGWYSGEQLLSTNKNYAFIIDKNVTAKFKSKQETSNLIFTADKTTFNITGIKDKTVTQIIIPNYTTSIGESSFSGCSSLEEITIPFVGAVAGKTSSDTYQYPFGYIFGTSSYTGGTATKQYYYGSSTSSTTFSTYYIPTSLKKVTVTGGNILKGAFYNCSSLTDITIPDSVTSIGSSAFDGCSSLTSITIPNSVTSIGDDAFENCSSLTSITIPNSVTSIGGGAFRGCSSLTSITIPNSVTSIGDDAFYNCSSLENIYYTGDINGWVQIDGLGYLMQYSKSTKNLYIQDKLLTEANITTATKISGDAFRGCSSLTSVTIGNSVTSIGGDAFRGCSSLTSITIPNSVTSIRWFAFSGCSSLTRVSIPDSVTNIGYSAFSGCSSLEEITIPFVGAVAGKTSSDTYQYPFGYIFGTSSYTGGTATKQYYYGSSTSSTTFSTYYIPTSLKKVTVTGGNILKGAFYNCSSLTDITIPDSVTSIGSSAFDGCSSLTSITIPDSVMSIGESAFYNCGSLTSITIGNSVTRIGDYAFFGCTAEIKWGDNPTITNIGEYAFSEYEGTSITIPDSVTSICNLAFYNCSSLENIYYTGDINGWVQIDGLGYLMQYSKSTKNLYIQDKLLTEANITTATKISDYAFYIYTHLTSITIGNNVTSIGEYAFSGCTAKIKWGDNPTITSIGSYAFDGYAGTSITIPDSVKDIGDSAFYNCRSLTSITIPDSVMSIGESAFYNCGSLTSITIGNSVTSIESNAFWGCSSLTTVYYKGTQAEWGKISIGINNSYLTNANIILFK